MTVEPSFPATARAVLQRRSGITIWKQIADTLAQEIRDRHYLASGCLPSETALATRFKVNRHTLRQALADLQAQGLLRIEQGRGAFVQSDWVDYTLARRTRYSENMLRNRLHPVRQMLAGREEAATSAVAQALGLRRGGRVLVAELLQMAGEQPLGLATMYFPAARFAGLLDRLAAGDTVTQALQALGVADYSRVRSRVTTLLPDEALARTLCQPRARPVLCVESVDADTEGRPVKYGLTQFSGDRVQLVVDTADLAA
ncbi:MAG: phosphonate metabolism transcriptional regulator PhnF [Burkholderiales bacterium]|nr:phosphonate metabolism transcriptional regulator PhnF [Burkholderiales bacterium]